jgi:2-keto-4-pentenoate hydratase/2-oxohepta-3-ene-1,7-dioic acid hydratase in catechol pathway
MFSRSRIIGIVSVALATFWNLSVVTAQSVSSAPDTPFRLATFSTDGYERVGLVLGDRILDITAASEHLAAAADASPIDIPDEMKSLIEEYEGVKERLYQVANYFDENGTAGHAFAFDLDDVALEAPIKYPWNLIAAAANYKAHATGMASDARPQSEEQPAAPRRRGGFDPSRIADIVPERDAPVMFAKSPRSCIIASGEPYYIPPGRERIDWEGEIAVIIGKPAYLVTNEDAHDYVFGYSVMYDVSDRSGRVREVSMFPGPNWFDSKSTRRCAPFGPFIMPKEFVPDYKNLRIITKVNGEQMQDQTTADLIWNEANLIRYTTSILNLYPGDVIAMGTPSGTGAEQGKFLKAGDVVSIELEGISTLVTPMEAYPGETEH